MTWTQYRTNNSGGDWWLEDKDWYALEKAGWIVNWCKDDPFYQERALKYGYDDNTRFLGTLAKNAYYPGSERMAMASFQDITGENPEDDGCNCCGSPHDFYEVDSLPEHLLDPNIIDGEVLPERKEITSG